MLLQVFNDLSRRPPHPAHQTRSVSGGQLGEIITEPGQPNRIRRGELFRNGATFPSKFGPDINPDARMFGRNDQRIFANVRCKSGDRFGLAGCGAHRAFGKLGWNFLHALRHGRRCFAKRAQGLRSVTLSVNGNFPGHLFATLLRGLFYDFTHRCFATSFSELTSAALTERFGELARNRAARGRRLRPCLRGASRGKNQTGNDNENEM
jgi:hypothetical protein